MRLMLFQNGKSFLRSIIPLYFEMLHSKSCVMGIIRNQKFPNLHLLQRVTHQEELRNKSVNINKKLKVKNI